MPNVLVITLLESVQLVVISLAVCVDLRLFVSVEDASHCPFAVDEATVPDFQFEVGVATRTDQERQFLPDAEHSIGFVDDHKLTVCFTSLIVTVAEPAETV